MYTLLVGPPASGKTEAINPTEYFWNKARRLKVAPRSVTRASLVDELAEAQKRLPIGPTELIEYASLNVSAGELGVLLPAHDTDFLSVLNHLYDNPPWHSEKRRTMKINHHIVNPQLNILAGTQPAYLASLLPEEAWGMGFMSRQIMIYSSQVMQVELFPEFFGLAEGNVKRKALENALASDMIALSELYGQARWDIDAATELRRWYLEGMKPVPEHSKLTHYTGRRVIHIGKLSMIASLSRGSDLKITLSDLNRARDWLLEAEMAMPDIFREMVGRSDAQVLTELHFYMFAQWRRNGQKPLHKSALYNFLSTQAPSDKIPRLLSVAEQANMIARVAGSADLYIPRPKNEHGME